MRQRRKAEGWIDVHAHFHIPKTPTELDTIWKMMHRGCFLAPTPFEWTVEGALDHMDRHGVAMQLLSNIPKTLAELQDSNAYGAAVVGRFPSRFGLLAALPTDDPDAALGEITRADALCADGFAMTCDYNGVLLSDASLAPVWRALNGRGAAVFIHPNAYAPPSLGRPSALLEVAFETARTLVDMLYKGILGDFPDIKFVVAHCGGALPALSGRLALLGAEPWVPNARQISADDIRRQLGRLFLDTAATGTAHSLKPALAMTTCDHLLYGSDCGVACSSETTLAQNMRALLDFADLSEAEIQQIGKNALQVFPTLEHRLTPAGDAGTSAANL